MELFSIRIQRTFQLVSTLNIHAVSPKYKRVRQDSLVESAFQDCGQLVQLASAVQRE